VRNNRDQKIKQRRRIRGRVVKISSLNTVKVKVETYQSHPIYRKRFKITKHYQVHDFRGQCKVGDLVTIEESRPFSGTKRFKVIYDRK